VLGVACASRNAGREVAADQRSITQRQLMDHKFQNAYDAVQALHPQWLETRGTDSFSAPSVVWVYLNNTKLGRVETLRGLAPIDIVEIRHYLGIDASARWGVGHNAGVIFVSTW